MLPWPHEMNLRQTAERADRRRAYKLPIRKPALNWKLTIIYHVAQRPENHSFLNKILTGVSVLKRRKGARSRICENYCRMLPRSGKCLFERFIHQRKFKTERTAGNCFNLGFWRYYLGNGWANGATAMARRLQKKNTLKMPTISVTSGAEFKLKP